MGSSKSSGINGLAVLLVAICLIIVGGCLVAISNVKRDVQPEDLRGPNERKLDVELQNIPDQKTRDLYDIMFRRAMQDADRQYKQMTPAERRMTDYLQSNSGTP